MLPAIAITGTPFWFAWRKIPSITLPFADWILRFYFDNFAALLRNYRFERTLATIGNQEWNTLIIFKRLLRTGC